MFSLIIPPVSDCFMPLLGIPQISGYLKSRGIPCKVYDIGIDCLEQLTSDMFVESYIKKLKKNNKYFDFDIDCLANMVRIQTTDEKQFTKGGKYSNAVKKLNFISAFNKEYRITTDTLISDFNWWDAENISCTIKNKSLLDEVYIELPSVQEILKSKNKYIGISICYESQIIPSLILSKIIKENQKGISIIFGGSLFYTYEKNFHKIFTMSNLIDILVVGPGERVLELLAKNSFKNLSLFRDAGIEVNQVSNKYIIYSKSIENKINFSLPDFLDVNFHKYL